MADNERERKPDTTDLEFHSGQYSTSKAPVQKPPAGTYVGPHVNYPDTPQPTLFKTFELPNKLTLKNRIIVSPMCQYSAESGTGMPSDYHLSHLGAFAMRGPALVITEATAVLHNGMISPEDLGIWSDKHIPPFRRIADFIHSCGSLAGIQLAHAGRKASTYAPWERGSKGAYVPEEEHGWKNVWAPSAIPFDDGYAVPIEMTLDNINEFKQAFVDGAKRAIAAGFDVLDIHGAHGYAISEFLSPKSNQRTDQYGGSLENRLRLVLEIVRDIKALAPKEVAVFVRISATEWDPAGEKAADGSWQSWGIEQSIILAKELHKLGVDLLDVSSGGNYAGQKIDIGPGYQVPLAEAIKKAVPGLPISSVGLITSGKQANEILESGRADAIMLARELLRNADFVFDAAQELHSVVKVPVQYDRAYTRMKASVP
ncbi:FMN-linked oxidoreductase [Cystobasidium minutum MCA 4210]|uniref:FMN-linked oxidoreductase n=1 Tax=Cystobasidium minutum MCA 4210 TaxID=1397322 RepID=UPI0034D013C2|eukprot:jgi/Rhomi1/190600/estExt_fgenesh1_pg.C_5_t10418